MRLFAYHIALACVISTGATQNVQTASNCSTFAWDKQPAYIRNDTITSPVSAAYTCPSSHNTTHGCPIKVTGDLPAQFKSNLSSSVLRDYDYKTERGDGVSFYFDLVNRTVSNTKSWTDVPLKYYTIGNVNAIKSLPSGTSGYVEFVQSLQCYAGTLSDCQKDTLKEQTAVEFCAPLFHSTALKSDGGQQVLDGIYSIKQVNASEVNEGKYKDPFKGQSRGEDDGDSTGTASTLKLGLLSVVLMAVTVVMIAQ